MPNNYKTQLNNYAATFGYSLRYADSWKGTPLDPIWESIAYVNGLEYGRGQGRKVKAASEAAASNALVRLRDPLTDFGPPINTKSNSSGMNDKESISISDFVLCRPNATAPNLDSSNFHHPVGCVFAVYDSLASEEWLDEHCNEPILESLYKRIDLPPLADYLSTESPAISIFSDDIESVKPLCHDLARTSGFPILIRPERDFPLNSLKHYPRIKDTPMDVDDSGSSGGRDGDSVERSSGKGNTENNRSEDSSKEVDDSGGSRSGGEDGDHGENDIGGGADTGGNGTPESNDNERRNNPSSNGIQSNEDGLSSGGGNGDPSGSYSSKSPEKVVHTTTINMPIADEGRKSEAQFLEVSTENLFTPIPNIPVDHNHSDKLSAFVEIDVQTGDQLIINGGVSAVTFLVKEEDTTSRYFARKEPIEDITPVKLKYGKTAQNTTTTGSNVAFGLQPKAEVTSTRTGQFATVIEAVEDQVATSSFMSNAFFTNPNYHGYHNATVNFNISPRHLDNPTGHNSSYLVARHGLRVTTSDQLTKSSPKVSFLYRLQIHCRLRPVGSDRWRGLVIFQSHHIPDVKTEKTLCINESRTLDLKHPERNSSCQIAQTSNIPPSISQPDNIAIAFGTALEHPAGNRKEVKISFWDKYRPRIKARERSSSAKGDENDMIKGTGTSKAKNHEQNQIISSKGEGKVTDQVKPITFTAQLNSGWDDTTKCFVAPVWPWLDEKFKPTIDKHSNRVAAMQLEWKDEDE